MNRKHYEKRSTVTDYAHTKLQNPEVMILVKYREHVLDKYVLDVGCGAGRTTLNLKNLSKHYVGLDYSFDMIESCKREYKDVRFIHGDVRDMSMFEDDMFDFILFAYNGLDSIGHEDRLRGMREIHRVLKDDGVFTFSSHNLNYKNAIAAPGMTYTFGLCAQVMYLVKFVKSLYNHSINKRNQYFGNEYSIINDRAHNYSMLTYYIDKKNQVAQLGEVGFEIIEIYDTLGNILDIDSEDNHSAWIYYVARKTT